MWGAIASIFTGGAVKSIENIASEWIETDLESAEAKVLMVKTLDPNGLMRRDLSQRVTALYTLYLAVMLSLLAIEFVAVMAGFDIDFTQLAVTTDKVVSLFVPITTLFGAIVSASFGVNYANTKHNK